MTDYLHHPIVQGALSGAVSAALIDFNAFRAWKSYRDAVAYDWPTAIWRWFQGAVAGAVTAAGFSATS